MIFWIFRNLRKEKISLANKTAQIGELLDNIIKSYSYDALTRRITIKPEIDPELYRLQVVIDTLRFSQVMNNLLSNAIKFSPAASEVRVVAEILHSDEHQCAIKFSVLDQGPGIPADKLDLVMQRFQQLHEPNKDQIGTGLGLPIVVQILQLFQSGLQFAPVSPNGSDFFFELKLPVLQNKIETMIRKDSVEQWENILIVDDDPQITMLYEHFFTDQKISHKVIQDIADLSDLDTLQFDALITDNYLGQNSVLKYIPVLKKSQVQKHRRFCSPVIIILSHCSSAAMDILIAFYKNPYRPMNFFRFFRKYVTGKRVLCPDSKVYITIMILTEVRFAMHSICSSASGKFLPNDFEKPS